MTTNFEAICKQELNDIKRKKQGNKHRDFDDIMEQIFSYPNCHNAEEFEDINFETIRKNAMTRKSYQVSGQDSQLNGASEGALMPEDFAIFESLGKRVPRKSSTLEDILDKP